MHSKRKLAALVGAAIAPIIAVSLPSGSASAHGYVNSPPSRQAQCAAGVVECGEIKYEPQSVEGPKGLSDCAGGNSRFQELNDDSKGWTRTQVGTTATFTWTYTARHATSTWQYFVGGQQVGEYDGGGVQPGETTTHEVNLSGFSGDQTVLAVWNIADTGNAFYACVDVTVG